MTKPTMQYSAELQGAFDHFNAAIFNDELPDYVLSLQRKRRALGYFWPDRFEREGTDRRCHEIAMNPDDFEADDIPEVLSTLAHAMVHLWQQCFGKPSRNGYHNREWADEMDAVGLAPTHDGSATGRRTGQRVTNLIESGGPFAEACADWLGAGNSITWRSRPTPKRARTKSGSRTKYVCGECQAAVWGKPGLAFACVECEPKMVAAPRPQL